MHPRKAREGIPMISILFNLSLAPAIRLFLLW
jgi:hypothetical protein